MEPLPVRVRLALAAWLLLACSASASAATVSVFTCPGGQQLSPVDGSGNNAPSCAAGGGSWVQVEIAEAFDPSLLDAGALGDAFAAGFVVMATGLVILNAPKFLLAAARGRR